MEFLKTYLIFNSTPTVTCQKQSVSKFWLSDDFKLDWSGSDVTLSLDYHMHSFVKLVYRKFEIFLLFPMENFLEIYDSVLLL